MQIVKVSKTGNFYKVKFDNDEVYKFHESIIISYGFIRSKIEVSKEKLSNAILENEYFLALDKGIKYCYSTRCEHEVFLYLLKHYDKEMAKKVVNKLNELKLINDSEYAKEYVLYAIRKLFGPEKIYVDLKELNVSSLDIEEALSIYSDEMILDSSLKLADKYIPRLKNDSNERKRIKLRNYLKEHGFSNEIVAITLEKKQDLIHNISGDENLLNREFNKLLKGKKPDMDERKFKQKVIRSLCGKGFLLQDVLKLFESGCKL